ncbi:non-ribosomal peptide synthase/polyketide synthase [Chitinophaga varians]|uniref:Non-ribosomal peptide synthase/polyketide synthase n=1 Tax=Chitinophaga varians TaxID=2202339 RepID=A0A847S2Q0_9BACT|nr:non-ribosomal peptide synthase/polyketide synthase [Chitinophaga varians]NLR67705.1 non-ribosomal peptide synthase/polyketide synthase [Chitinophaga varians]
MIEVNFDKAIAVVAKARAQGVILFLEDGKIKFRTPKDAGITPELLEEIKLHRDEINALLHQSISAETAPIKAGAAAGHTGVRLSFSQERLWFIDQLEGSVKYHIPIVLKLKGDLHVEALQQALRTIVNRHEVLRTVFRDIAGVASQLVLDKDAWQMEMITAPEYYHDPAALAQAIQTIIDTPFDLATDHMLRASLITPGAGEYILVVVMHHIAADGWSTGIIVRELVELYHAGVSGAAPQLPAMEIQYADYAVWQRQYLSGDTLAAQLGYWRGQLSGTPVLDLPADYPRPAVQSSRGAVITFNLDRDESDKIKTFSRQQGVTVFMTLLAAFKVLLYRYTGQEDICVGTPVAGRTRKETDNLVGFFINSLALRSDLSGHPSFISLLQQVKQTTLAAYDYQELPFEKIVEVVVKERDMARNPLFQVMFALQNTPAAPELELDGVTFSYMDTAHTTAKFDLTCSFEETTTGFAGRMEYCTDLFDASTIQRMIGHLQLLIKNVLQTPDEPVHLLPLLSAEEREQALTTFNNTAVPYADDQSIVALYSAWAQQTPKATALLYGDAVMSYGELETLSNQLAHYLRSKGVQQGGIVPVCTERSIDMMVGILAILKTGAAYMPLDPAYPAERLRFMLDESRSSVLLTTTDFQNRFLEEQPDRELVLVDQLPALLTGQPDTMPGNPPSANDLAYVMYTSGSTGKPKGVLVTHRNVTSLVLQPNYVSLDAGKTILSAGSLAFDATTFEYWGALLHGGRLALSVGNSLLDSAVFKQELYSKAVTTLFITTSWFNQLVDTDITVFARLSAILTGGEKMSEKHVERFRQAYPDISISNIYGPTENTTFSLSYYINDRGPASNTPIGVPLNNRTAYVLDDAQQLVPVGVAGELYVGGAGLASGYLDRPELTAEKFIAHPFSNNPEEKLYRTGDRARWLPDGNIVYMGRVDDQVKIRGHRIEPGEVEGVLLASPDVAQGIVVVKTDDKGIKRLVAYVVPVNTLDKDQLVSYLKVKLPEYMVPSVIVPMDKFPVTANGKIDKKALPEPELNTLSAHSYVAPRTKVGSDMAQIWQELLGVPQVGIYDNFFELGGDSIITIQVVSRARKAGIRLHPRDLFQHQTIERLEILLSENKEQVMTGEQGLLTGESGLIPIQRWFFDNNAAAAGHFNQSVLVGIDKKISPDRLSSAIRALVRYHDALRFVYHSDESGWHQTYGTYEAGLAVEDLREIPEGSLPEHIAAYSRTIHQSLDITKGILMRAVLLQTPHNEEHNRLLIIVHHLAVDGVSWRILLEDLEVLLQEDAPALTLDKGNSYRQWYEALVAYSAQRRLTAQLPYWEKIYQEGRLAALKEATPFEGKVTIADVDNIETRLDAGLTRHLLQDAPQAYHTEINDILLSALALAVGKWNSSGRVCIGLESHGRHDIGGMDISRTVGWFTSLYPVLLEVDSHQSPGAVLRNVKEQLRAVPDKGIGFGVLKQLLQTPSLQGNDPWDIVFNYLGQSDRVVKTDGMLSLVEESSGAGVGDNYVVQEKLGVNSIVNDGSLILIWSYSRKHFQAQQVQALADDFILQLQQLIADCLAQQTALVSPSDYGLQGVMTINELDTFLDAAHTGISRRAQVSGLYRLSALQEGMLFHSLYDQAGGAYIEQFGCDLLNVQPNAFKAAWEHLLRQHTILRTAFFSDEAAIPLQGVFKEAALPFRLLDYSSMDEAARRQAVEAFTQQDATEAFDFKTAPLMRIALIKLTEGRHRLLWTFHHILFDGWSVPVLMESLLHTYEALVNGRPVPEGAEDRYEDFIRYLETRDEEKEEQYWRRYMEGVEDPTLLPFVRSGADRTREAGTYKDHILRVDETLTAKINAFAQQQHVTVNTLMQGVWALLLHHYTGQDHITYGVTVSGRPEDLAGVEQRVGMYINTIPLHTEVPAQQTLGAWLQELQSGQLQSREFQHTGLDTIRHWCGIAGDLFDTLLVFENYPVSKVIEAQAWQLQIENVAVQEKTNYPLTVLVGAGETINIRFSYNTALLADNYLQAIAGHFETLLSQLPDNADNLLPALPWLTTTEEQLLRTFNDTAVKWPEQKTLVDLFAAQVDRTPLLTAVVDEQASLTYRELDALTNQLANYLNSKGVGAETLVPVCLERSLDMIVAIVAILKAGAAYVPVDPTYPEERILHILEDTNADIILTDHSGFHAIPDNFAGAVRLDEIRPVLAIYPDTPPTQVVQPGQLAYVIYTSGSTGKPKGVMNEHAGVVNRLLWTQKYFGLNGDDAILQKTTFCFDVSVWELLWPLICGARLVMAIPDGQKDTGYLKNAIDRYGITTVHFVPSMLQLFLEDVTPDDVPGLKRVLCSGEALKPQHVSLFREKIPYAGLYNLYGPTEAAIDVTCWHVPDDLGEHEIVSIGQPVANTQLYILDKAGGLLPPGVFGELHIGGVQVARGYLNRETLTAEKFIDDPFSNGRLYKTGDWCRWLPDGNIEYAGRIDDQVKIRGFRIELGEIESVLLENEQVSEAVVVAKDAPDGSKRLIGYVVPAGEIDRTAVLDNLKRRLPEYMVPAVLIPLPVMPLTASGKINRKALPAPDETFLASSAYVAPGNETEQVLANIFQHILGISRVGVNDNFFALGGNSLLSMRLVAAVRKQLQLELPVKAVFTHATVASLAAHLLEQEHAAPVLPVVEAVSRPERVPLSFSQERLWFIDQLEGSVQYHIPVVLRLKGALDKEALASALQTVINRHEILRTVIAQEDGVAWQRLLDRDQWQLTVTDEPVYHEDPLALSSLVHALVQAPFDLAKDHMMRAHLVVLSPTEHVLVAVIHHIASDGWSSAIMVKELVDLYRSFVHREASQLPELPLQYADYAIWQRRYLTDTVLASQLDYWKEKLGGVETLQLPTDYSRPAVQRNRGAVTWFRLDGQLTAGLRSLAQQQEATLFMTLLAAFKVLLFRYSGQEDICVGSPVAGRTRQETESLIGFFINTLALRSYVDGEQSFHSLLQAVKETTLNAYQHQEIPFEKVVEAVVKERDLSRSPLFQVMFTLQNMPDSASLELEGLQLAAEPLSYATTQYDLSFTLEDTAEGLRGSVEYCTDLYVPGTIDRMVQHFEQLLRSVVAAPAARLQSLPMLGKEEEIQLLYGFNPTSQPAPETDTKTLAILFEEQAKRTPAATALVFGNTALTYQELDERAGQLAAQLARHGVGAGALVPLCIDRSLNMMVAILGILKAGGAYVPLDPQQPEERIGRILEDMGGDPLIVTTPALTHLFPPKAKLLLPDDWNNPAGEDYEIKAAAPEDTAYVIYTSGSTGVPKGVVIPHAAIVNFIVHRSRDFSIDVTDRVLQFSNYCFDASVEQMFLPLVNGAVLVLIPEALRLDRQEFELLLEQEKITHLDTTPGFLASITPGNYGSLRRVVSGGEACSLQLAAAWAPHVDFHNEYGPTETTVVATAYHFQLQQAIGTEMLPIGKPLTNVRAYILDNNHRPVPIGVPGELFIGGIQVAKGYLNNPTLTAEKFVYDTFSGHNDKLYRTGDLACWLADGNIAYLGRIDDQVKLRGYRIELGEIESALSQHPDIREAIAAVKADSAGHKRLVAYLTGETLPEREALSAFLRDRLPEYMVPVQFIQIATIPLTPNGKVDKKALPVPDVEALSGNAFVAPRNEAESQLAAIWQNLLNVQQVGIYDNFFELGGDSIITIQAVSRARKAGLNLHPADLFRYQTIAGLAAMLASKQDTPDSHAEQGLLTGASGLLPIQHWYFAHTADVTGETHFNQALLLEVDKTVEVSALETAIERLLQHHDALRFSYTTNDGQWQQTYGAHNGTLEVIDLRDETTDTLPAEITTRAEYYQRSLHPEQGIVTRTVFMTTPDTASHNRLLIVVHHLAIDGVSWRILLEDLDQLLKQAATALPLKSNSYRQWQETLTAYGQRPKVQAQLAYWQQTAAGYTPLQGDKAFDGAVTIRDTANHVVRLNAGQTRRLLQDVPKAYHTEINDLLLCALAITLQEWNNTDNVTIGLEGHGREAIDATTDISRTIGWFTSLYPVKLSTGAGSIGERLKAVKEQLRNVPDKGLGYGVLKYLQQEPALQGNDPWDVVFNYLGQTGNITATDGLLRMAAESPGAAIGKDFPLTEKIAVDSMVQDGELVLRWKYSSQHFSAAALEKMAAAYIRHLEALITHCADRHEPAFTPSDFGLGREISVAELDTFLDAKVGAVARRTRISSLYRLTGLQEAMLFHALYDEHSNAYMEQFTCDLLHLNEPAFIQSWNLLLQRHTALRSGFHADEFSIPVQGVYQDVQVPVVLQDYRGLTAEEQQEDMAAFLEADRNKGFDFSHPPLMRLALIRLDDDRHRMVWTSHHILFDGWSLPLILENLLRIYEAVVTQAPLPVFTEDHYENYVRYLERQDKEQEEAFWRNYIKNATDATLLPFIGAAEARNAGVGSYRQELLELDEAVTRNIHQFAHRHRITPNTIIQGVWSYLLYRYTGRREITFGITVSGRPEGLPGVEQAVGMYINTLPLCAVIDPARPVTAWLQELQASQLQCREYQYTPLDDMQRWTGITGDWFDTLLVYENYPVSKMEAAQQGALGVENIAVHEQTNLPLEILAAVADTIRITLRYNADLMADTYIAAIRGHFEEVLLQMTAHDNIQLHQLDILTAAERILLTETLNSRKVAFPQEKTAVSIIRERADMMPDATAIIFGETELTYRVLEERSNQVAHYLQSLGVKKDMAVPICIERSPEMVVGILGILKAGGAYVPVDTAYPAERIAFLLEDVEATVVLSSLLLKEKIAAVTSARVIALDDRREELFRQPVAGSLLLPSPADLAYIIYTSGSTGKPKGVLIEHRGMLNHLYAKINDLRLDHRSVIAFTASYTFDISVWQMLAALLCGGTTIIYSEETIMQPEQLMREVNRQQVTILELVPSYLATVLQEDIPVKLDDLEFLLVTGEAVSQQVLAQWFMHPHYNRIPVVNAYGPTEASDDICHYIMYETPVQSNIPLGYPVQNLNIYVVNEAMQLCPPGVPGEVCVSGVGVGRGYLKRPELTAEKFITDPFITGMAVRMYRTGDLGRWLPDGTVEYLGRMDDQVKIRGFRVELGEIEHALQLHEQIQQAVVVARADRRGHKQLAAYVVTTDAYDRDNVYAFLKGRLPEYMVPSWLVPLEKLPLTANGKIDRKALPAPDEVQGWSSQTYIAPRNETEAQLAAVWEDLLGIEKAGVQDNFFDLGGHSLQVIRLTSTVRRQFGVEVNVRTFFQLATIEQLARYIRLNLDQPSADDDDDLETITL